MLSNFFWGLWYLVVNNIWWMYHTHCHNEIRKKKIIIYKSKINQINFKLQLSRLNTSKSFHNYPLYIKRRLDCSLSVFIGGCKKEGDRLFSSTCCDRTRKDCFKLEWEDLNGYKEKNIRVVKIWNTLPRDEDDALFLETFKDRLDGTLSKLI